MCQISLHALDFISSSDCAYGPYNNLHSFCSCWLRQEAGPQLLREVDDTRWHNQRRGDFHAFWWHFWNEFLV